MKVNGTVTYITSPLVTFFNKLRLPPRCRSCRGRHKEMTTEMQSRHLSTFASG